MATAKVMEKAAPALRQPPLKPGIYFDLDEDRYHKDPAIGSTNIRSLLRSGPDYWWESPMNLIQPGEDTDTKAKIVGKAIHTLTFYGPAKFKREYVRRPDDAPRASSSQKAQITKEAKANLKDGQNLIHGSDYDRTLILGAMLSKNPYLAGSFDGSFYEVSVFWERDGLMFKARFDSLKPQGIGDLKSITNTRGLDFKEACIYAINRYGYVIQAAHYFEARRNLEMLVSTGSVFGRHDPNLLREIVRSKEYIFQWIFFQKEGAPNTWGKKLSPENPVVDIANLWRETAIERYKKFRESFGEDMWILAEPVEELDLSEMWASFKK